jgi:hypothetical protein
MTPHDDYAALCKRVKWGYEGSWYEECGYCKEVVLVLPSLTKPTTLICENCFDEGRDD